jgi:hypothetical protein
VVTIRAELAEAIRDKLSAPAPRVIDHARVLDAITAPVVLLERTQVAKAPNALGGYWVTFTLHVVVPTVDPSTQDDNLDNTLDNVLAALDAIPWLRWSNAIRSVFLDSWPSFQITVETVTERTQGV